MDLPCQVTCQAFSLERCKTAKVEVGKDTELDLCVCTISWQSIWGRRVLDGCRLASGAERDQVADQHQEGDWMRGVSNELPACGTLQRVGADARACLLPHSSRARVLQKWKLLVA